MRIIRLGFVAATIWATGVQAQEPAELWRTQVGAWIVGAYQGPNGNFSHCATSVPYANGVALIFFIDSGASSWRIRTFVPTGRLPVGSTRNLAFSIDGAAPIYRVGTAVSATSIEAELPATSEVFTQFRRGQTLYLTIEGTNTPPRVFDLTNSAQALQLTLECSARFAKSNNMPGTQHAKSQNQTDPKVVAEATSVLANTLAASGIPGFKIVNEFPPQVANYYSAAWKAGEIWGAIHISASDTTGAEANVAAEEGKGCSGDFATARRKSERGAILLRTACQTATGSEVANFVIAPRAKGGVYVFFVGVLPGSDASTAPVNSEEAGARIFEASFETLAPK